MQIYDNYLFPHVHHIFYFKNISPAALLRLSSYPVIGKAPQCRKTFTAKKKDLCLYIYIHRYISYIMIMNTVTSYEFPIFNLCKREKK